MKLELGFSDISLVFSNCLNIEDFYSNLKNGRHLFHYFQDSDVLVSSVSYFDDELRNKISNQNINLAHVDRTILLLLFCAKHFPLSSSNYKNVMLSIGSSRGATGLWEKAHEQFLAQKKVPNFTSPYTTLGNLAFILSQYFNLNGPIIEHSMTCSTGLQALLNGAAWINSNMADTCVVGASEMPLTAFTIRQMQALRIYSKNMLEHAFPSRPLDSTKTENTLVLGEAALLLKVSKLKIGHKFQIVSAGTSLETQKHPISVNSSGEAFQVSMAQALESAGLEHVDVVITHATGTMKGDASEMKAIKIIFEDMPLCTSTKWLTGHTLAAAGLIGVAFAIIMLEKQEFIGVPYLMQPHIVSHNIKYIMINTLGFGGQAISIIIKKNED